MSHADVMRWADAMGKGCTVVVDTEEWDIESVSRDGVSLGRDARPDEIPAGQPRARVEWGLDYEDQPHVYFRPARQRPTPHPINPTEIGDTI